MATVQSVPGLSDLLNTMKQLPRELVAKNGGVLRKALGAAAIIIRNAAREKAPKKTGNLARNIIASRRKDAPNATERYSVGVRAFRWSSRKKQKAKRTAAGKIDYRASGDAFYWRFQEFGTSKERAQPFLRPAFEQEKQNALDRFVQVLSEGLQRIVKRLARPAQRLRTR